MAVAVPAAASAAVSVVTRPFSVAGVVDDDEGSVAGAFVAAEVVTTSDVAAEETVAFVALTNPTKTSSNRAAPSSPAN